MDESGVPSIRELIDRIDSALAADDGEISTLRAELDKFRDENTRLHEVEEQLEYYFALCRAQSEMLKESADLQARTLALLLDKTN